MLIWDPSDQLVSGSVIRDSESGTGQSGGPTVTGPVEDLGERNRHKTKWTCLGRVPPTFSLAQRDVLCE